MNKIRAFYETYRVYLTRKNLEIIAVAAIVLSALSVFVANIPSKGVLELDNGKIVYNGSLVRGKMTGKGTITFENGDKYKGDFRNGTFDGEGVFTAVSGWKYEGSFSNGQAEGQGTLTTESKIGRASCRERV